MNNKICILTGATSGIGKATARSLVTRSFDLIITCREIEKGNALKKELLYLNPTSKIDVYLCDLSSQGDIRKFISQINASYQSIDVLINNAGVLNTRLIKTVDGIENTFAVNVLSQFMLSNLLSGLLAKSEAGRIINLTSDSYIAGKIDFGNLNCERKFSAIGSYANSALARILNTYYHASLLKDTSITVNCLHPGATNSNIGNNNKGLVPGLLNILKPFFKNPSKAAQTLVYLATSTETVKITGKYFVNAKIKKTTRITHDMTLAREFWEKCTSMIERGGTAGQL